MLHQVLRAFEQADGPLSLDALSRELGIERGVLDGIIAFWVRKGRLSESGGSCRLNSGSCSCSAHPEGCPFAYVQPRSISLKS